MHSDVLRTDEISDHDMPYAILNIKKERYEQRYKYILSEKDIDINSYVSDFRELPLSLVYAFDKPDDQVTILNELILDCVEKDHKNYKSGISAKGCTIKKPKRSMEHNKSPINRAADSHKTTSE